MKTTTIAANSRPANRHPVGTNIATPALALVSFMLAAGTVVCLNAQELTVSMANSARLEWSLPAEDCIVVGASSLASNAVWTPWPEPIFKRFGKFCMTVPTTNTQQYFKLVPGTQFIDDFDPLKEPFASRNDWLPWFSNGADASRFAFTIVNGAFQVETLMPPLDGMVAIFPPGGGEILRDFCASVDILDWASSLESAFGFVGRVQGGPGGVNNFYLGSVRMNATAGTGQLWFFDGASSYAASDVFSIEADSDYRLEFSVVGSRLRLRLLRLSEPPTLVREGTRQASLFSQGRVALWVNTLGSSGYRRTVDNLFVTGTRP